jgi:hypothetical protein
MGVRRGAGAHTTLARVTTRHWQCMQVPPWNVRAARQHACVCGWCAVRRRATLCMA